MWIVETLNADAKIQKREKARIFKNTHDILTSVRLKFVQDFYNYFHEILRPTSKSINLWKCSRQDTMMRTRKLLLHNLQ